MCFRPPTRPPTRASKTGPRFRLEALEDRSLMSVTPFDMFPGNPIPIAAPQSFSASSKANVPAAISNFQSAIGGVDNGNVAAPQATGSRDINWDAVKLDGTDFGGGANTTVISPGNTVGIPKNRFQTRGVVFDTVYAVSGDGFASVNPAATGLFPAFSPKNTFAMFNDNTIDFTFAAPSATGSAPAPAASRGFGAVFLNVEEAGTTSIEYFAGARSLGKFFVPAGGRGDTEFLGELFQSPIVTKVTIILGTDTLFNFDGTTFQAVGTDDTDADHNLAVTDDFFYGEPTPLANLGAVLDGSQGTNAAAAAVSATVGASFNGVVGTFSSANPAATAKDFFATVNWGDGHFNNGVVKANAQGGFDVVGTNTFASAGLFPIAVTAVDFGGSEVAVFNTAQVNKVTSQVTLASSTANGITGQSITFTAAVSTAPGATTPTGTVTFLDGATALGTSAVDASGVARLVTTLAPGSDSITAIYNGDGGSATSKASALTQAVSPDVTSLLALEFGAKKRRRGGFVQSVTIHNFGSNAISGPLVLVLGGLGHKVRLVNASGATQRISPPGSPFLSAGAGGLGSGASVSVELIFAIKRGKLNFSTRVFSGLSQP